MAVPRNDARKNLRNPTSGLVLTCDFDAKKIIEKKFKFSWGDMYPTTPAFYIVGFTSIAIDLPEDKFKNEHMLHEFFFEEYHVSFWG